MMKTQDRKGKMKLLARVTPNHCRKRPNRDPYDKVAWVSDCTPGINKKERKTTALVEAWCGHAQGNNQQHGV